MARTPSQMLDLGTSAPDFSLLEPISGNTVSKSHFDKTPLLVVFICNHCPYVVHIRDAFNEFCKEYGQKGLSCVAINANDVENYPDDHPDRMIDDGKKYNYAFSYLYDESQEVAKAYQAACTPDFFLFNDHHELYYRGQFDDARPRNDEPVTGADLKKAVDLLISGQPAPEEQKASLGCNIKWKVGNEPEYFG